MIGLCQLTNDILSTREDLESALGIIRALSISLNGSADSRMFDSDIVAALRAVDDLIGQSYDILGDITEHLSELSSKQREIRHGEVN